jgi:hypothetical protein
MQSFYPERFERDMGTSETEWLTALPRALGDHAFVLGTGQVRVQIGEGHLQLQWHTLPPRVIALLRLQRLAVSFVFEGVEEDARQRFMKQFDLTMQRGEPAAMGKGQRSNLLTFRTQVLAVWRLGFWSFRVARPISRKRAMPR